MKLMQYLTLHDLSPEVFAARVGVDRTTISRVARGVVNPSWPLMEAIYLKTKGEVTPNDFLKARRPKRVA